MSEHISDRNTDNHGRGVEGRRRQLRALLRTSADDARQIRQTPLFSGQVVRPVRRTIRERIAMLLSAAE